MRIHVRTYGCSMNQADSEIMLNLLRAAGHEITSEERADIIIINTCAVKQPTITKIMRELRKLKNKKVIIAGCLTQALPALLRDKFPEFSIMGVEGILNITSMIDDLILGKRTEELSVKRVRKAILPSEKHNETIGIIPISTGCLGSCSYCLTRKARGRLHSYPVKDIIKKARAFVKDGVKELWLTSQDCGCYGFDSGTNLPGLINAVTALKGDFRIRIGMMNPNHTLKILNELITAYDNKKVYKFLHLPVQSGSDEVLKSMRRQYRIKEFWRVIKAFRKAYPELTVATDVITAYPTETQEDFTKTKDLLNKLKPAITNISRYWPMPGTPAAELKQLPGPKSKNRSRELTQLCNKLSKENHEQLIGRTKQVLITEKGKAGSVMGRTQEYTPVIIKKELKLGEIINAKIINANENYVTGKPE